MKQNKTWEDKLEEEFGIHFKDSPDEFQFLKAFIKEIVDYYEEELRIADERWKRAEELYKSKCGSDDEI